MNDRKKEAKKKRNGIKSVGLFQQQSFKHAEHFNPRWDKKHRRKAWDENLSVCTMGGQWWMNRTHSQNQKCSLMRLSCLNQIKHGQIQGPPPLLMSVQEKDHKSWSIFEWYGIWSLVEFWAKTGPIQKCGCQVLENIWTKICCSEHCPFSQPQDSASWEIKFVSFFVCLVPRSHRDKSWALFQIRKRPFVTPLELDRTDFAV